MCLYNLTTGMTSNCANGSSLWLGAQVSVGAFDGLDTFYFTCAGSPGVTDAEICAFSISGDTINSVGQYGDQNGRSAFLYAATSAGPIFKSGFSVCDPIQTPWWVSPLPGPPYFYCIGLSSHVAASPNGNLFGLGLTIEGGPGGNVPGIYVISRTTGQIVWNISTIGNANFVMDGNDNLFASDGSQLLAFSPSGSLLWSLPGNFVGAISLGANTIYSYEALTNGELRAVAIDGTISSPSQSQSRSLTVSPSLSPPPSPSSIMSSSPLPYSPSNVSPVGLSVSAIAGIGAGLFVGGALITAMLCKARSCKSTTKGRLSSMRKPFIPADFGNSAPLPSAPLSPPSNIWSAEDGNQKNVSQKGDAQWHIN